MSDFTDPPLPPLSAQRARELSERAKVENYDKVLRRLNAGIEMMAKEGHTFYVEWVRLSDEDLQRAIAEFIERGFTVEVSEPDASNGRRFRVSWEGD